MYHRISDETHDPWNLCVSPSNFEEQLSILKANYSVIPLFKLIDPRQIPKQKKPIVAITFDDGYQDNFNIALPLLESNNLHATVFITTDMLNSTDGLWWDILADIILRPKSIASSLELEIGTTLFSWKYSETNKTIQSSNSHLDLQGSRHSLYHSLWSLMINIDTYQRNRHLHDLSKWTRLSEISDQPLKRSNLGLSTVQLRRLAESNNIEIGAHTSSHPLLSGLNSNQQQDEIESNRVKLESTLGTPIRLFSYPFGDYDKSSIEIVNRLGFEAAFTTEPSIVWRNSDPHLLPRHGVGNISGSRLQEKLESWFSF